MYVTYEICVRCRIGKVREEALRNGNSGENMKERLSDGGKGVKGKGLKKERKGQTYKI